MGTTGNDNRTIFSYNYIIVPIFGTAYCRFMIINKLLIAYSPLIYLILIIERSTIVEILRPIQAFLGYTLGPANLQ